MDLLKLELERKRKAIESAKKSNVSCNQGKRTYLKASELRRFREAQEEEERKKKSEILRESQARKKRRKDKVTVTEKKDGNVGKHKRTGDASSTDAAGYSNTATKINGQDSEQEGASPSSKKDTDEIKMTSSSITNALRELGIPVWLFGEKDDQQRLLRLQEARDSKKAEMVGLSEIDDFKLGSGHGIRNPFLGGKKDDEEDELELGLKKSNTSNDKHKEDTEQDLDDESDPHKFIHRFFKSQLKQWEEDLVNRPDSVKRSLGGKNETKTLKQCKDYIRPLLKQCKNRRLEESMMAHLLKIVKFCKEGEFVKANDAYIDVAIGRAAWPIGVTMVGIHARSGRAKIESSNVAHVMNSEMQRKYLTSVKRLITYCQKKRVDVAPSKKVTNV